MTGSRSGWLSGLAALALLLIGAVLGIAVDRLHFQHSGSESITFREVHENPIAAIEQAIDLRPEQRTQIEAILAKRQADVDTAWRNARGSVSATADSVIAEISALLDPDQAARFNALVKELHSTGRVHLPRH